MDDHFATSLFAMSEGQPVILMRQRGVGHMVGHEHIGMRPAAGFSGMLAQPIQIKKRQSSIGKEAGLAVIAALDEVKRDIRQREEGTACDDFDHFDRPNLLRKPWSVPYCPLLCPYY